MTKKRISFGHLIVQNHHKDANYQTADCEEDEKEEEEEVGRPADGGERARATCSLNKREESAR